MPIQTVFQRTEQKYWLSAAQYDALRARLPAHTKPDAYGRYTIRNLYIDTPDFHYIRASLEKPPYKEKLRLRCYGCPEKDGPVFLEIKKKVKGVVYKRRITLPLEAAEAYLWQGLRPAPDSQILREIDFLLGRYPGTLPRIYLAYDRLALAGAEEPDLRLTFDTNIRSRWDALRLQEDGGRPLREDGAVLMEIKSGGAIPLWLAHSLSALSIFPISFSKVGGVYRQRLAEHPPSAALTSLAGPAAFTTPTLIRSDERSKKGWTDCHV